MDEKQPVKSKPSLQEVIGSAKHILRFTRALVAGLESFFRVYGESEDNAASVKE